MYHGLLPIWKEKGLTSHDVVFKLRKILRMKRIGHTGTLDPDVEGVLVVCLGKGTKLVETLMDSDKVYRGEVTLGYSTDTEDASGQIIERTRVTESLSTEAIDQAMASMVGEIDQVPPMYSAVKVNGMKLYEYARQNIPVERPVRQVTIRSFQRLSQPLWDPVEGTCKFNFEVCCSKGTYVRTLAVDLAKQLGYPGHMSELVRLETSGCRAEQALTLEEVEQLQAADTLMTRIVSLEQAVRRFPQRKLNEEDAVKIQHGQVLPREYFGTPLSEPTALFFQDKVLAIYQPHPQKPDWIKPMIMF